MEFKTFIIVCPLVFLAGFIDSIAGGGGLISLPAYLFAGLPMHTAIGTNKLSSCMGTSIATGRFVRQGLVNLRLAIPGVICAFIGSTLGARLSIRTDEHLMEVVLIPVLCITAFIVLNRKLFHDTENDTIVLNTRTYMTASIAAFIVGIYDGFYGPGTGTFLIIAFTVFAGISIRSSNAQAKVINLTTNISALLVYILNGNVIWVLGLAAAACNMLGAYLGSGLAIKEGGKIVKPVILIVLALLFIKLIGS